MSEINLPTWAKLVDGSARVGATVEVDSDLAYKAWLDLLSVAAVDQYWLETAYQCIKMDVQTALEQSELSPARTNQPVQINFTRAPQYALAAHPVGRGTHAATKGREAREHYKRLRGRIPFSG